jgi:hypothetical protein
MKLEFEIGDKGYFVVWPALVLDFEEQLIMAGWMIFLITLRFGRKGGE